LCTRARSGGGRALKAEKFDLPVEGRRRTIIENVSPQVDGGRFPVKRVVGDVLEVQADVFGDGHDEVRARLSWRHEPNPAWEQVEMESLGNDRWRGTFPLTEIGRYEFFVSGWVDHWRTWVHDLRKRVDAGQDVSLDLQIGFEIVSPAVGRGAKPPEEWTTAIALDKAFGENIERHPDRTLESVGATYAVVVDPKDDAATGFYAQYGFLPLKSAGPRMFLPIAKAAWLFTG